MEEDSSFEVSTLLSLLSSLDELSFSLLLLEEVCFEEDELPLEEGKSPEQDASNRELASKSNKLPLLRSFISITSLIASIILFGNRLTHGSSSFLNPPNPSISSKIHAKHAFLI